MLFVNNDLTPDKDGLISVNFCSIAPFMKTDMNLNVWMEAINKNFLEVYLAYISSDFKRDVINIDNIIFKVKKILMDYEPIPGCGLYLKGQIEFVDTEASAQFKESIKNEIMGINFIPRFYTPATGETRFITFDMCLEKEE